MDGRKTKISFVIPYHHCGLVLFMKRGTLLPELSRHSPDAANPGGRTFPWIGRGPRGELTGLLEWSIGVRSRSVGSGRSGAARVVVSSRAAASRSVWVCHRIVVARRAEFKRSVLDGVTSHRRPCLVAA